MYRDKEEYSKESGLLEDKCIYDKTWEIGLAKVTYMPNISYKWKFIRISQKVLCNLCHWTFGGKKPFLLCECITFLFNLTTSLKIFKSLWFYNTRNYRALLIHTVFLWSHPLPACRPRHPTPSVPAMVNLVLWTSYQDLLSSDMFLYIRICFFIFHIEWYFSMSFSLHLTLLTTILSRSIHIIENHMILPFIIAR